MTPELEALRLAADGLLVRHASLLAHEVPEAIGLLEQMKVALMATGGSPAGPSDPTPAAPPPEEDQWLTADEVASKFGRTRAWVYRQAKGWTFAKKFSHKTLRISKRDLERWMQRR